MNYEYSFSGTDVKAFTEQGSKVFSLNSLATISFQVNEQKSPVRRLGRQGIVGFTRSIKTIAGTMVFVILKGHPLKDLMPNNNLIQRHKEINTNMPSQATNILPFNLRLKYKTEHSSYDFSELFIEGIEIISQSIVTSVNDMITELVVQFMAQDYKEFYSNNNDKENYLASLVTENDLNNDLQLQEQYNNELLLNKEEIQYAENDTNNYYNTELNNYHKRLLEIEKFNFNDTIANEELHNYINQKIEESGYLAKQEMDSYIEEKNRELANKMFLDNLISSKNKKYDISGLPISYLTKSSQKPKDYYSSFNNRSKELSKIIEELKGMKYNLEKIFSFNSLVSLENNPSSMIERIDKDIIFFTLEKEKNDQKLLSLVRK